MTVQVSSSGGPVPSGARGVVINVTVTATATPGYLTVWPGGGPAPTISDLNWVAGETVPNLVVAKLSSTGQVSVYINAGSADVIVDVIGFYP